MDIFEVPKRTRKNPPTTRAALLTVFIRLRIASHYRRIGIINKPPGVDKLPQNRHFPAATKRVVIRWAGMIIDGIPATRTDEGADLPRRAVAAFLRFIERKLDVSVIKNTRGLPQDSSLSEPLRLAKLLQERGVIKKLGRLPDLPDEPRTKSWYAICNDPTDHQVAGMSHESDSDALYAALAEGLERYLWFTQNDYFVKPTKATTLRIRKTGACIAPEEFAGFSDEQRAHDPEKQLRPDAEYLWVQGTSLVTGTRVYIPAQVVSRAGLQGLQGGGKEPLIRQPTTNGLATWPTQTGARLAGVNEVIEREAYMIMWLNQMTLPRISLAPLCSRHPALARSIEACGRYRLKTHVVRLLTDAPTHAVAVVIEDLSGIAPRFAIGLKAHRSLPSAIQKAMTEALRSRRGYRLWSDGGNTWNAKTKTDEMGHRERLHYWGTPGHAKNLEFLIQGQEIVAEPAAWENDTEAEHLQRITRWCAAKGFECISVSPGTSSKNPSSLHVEMVVMPQLQPMYLTEPARLFGGTRWRDVPTAFGYTPLKKPFADRPHPFS